MSDKPEQPEDDIIRVDAPDHVKPSEDPEGKVVVFLGGDKKAKDTGPTATEEIIDVILQASRSLGIAETRKSVVEKSFEHSTQSEQEIGGGFRSLDAFDAKVQDPPHDPEAFLKFLDFNEVHAACVEVKVRDTTSREYRIKSKYPFSGDGTETDIHGIAITEDAFQADCKMIKDFITNSNDTETFEETCFKVAQDRESIGWGAFEVIRQGNGRIARLQHIPAVRLRVLEGFQGFAEILPAEDHTSSKTRYRYYQPFGAKVGKMVPDVFDITGKKQIFRPYSPEEDGELKVGENGLIFRLMDPKTGEPMRGSVNRNFKNAANEVLFLPKTSNNTIYYGSPDIVPAIGAILSNVHIRDYQLQFFEHNCIPRYVVIIKGASVDDEFMEMIEDHFENRIKGSSHKTMIMALTGFGNRNIEVTFEKLGVEGKEADFLATKISNDAVIKAAHGIHDSVIGISQASQLGSGSGLSQGEHYKDRVVIPLQRYWASKLNDMFRLGLGVLNAEIEFDPKDCRDQEAVSRSLVQLVQAGIIDINEARKELGYESIEGGSVNFARIKNGSLVKVEDLPKIESELTDTSIAGGNNDMKLEVPKNE